nr:MAG: hypothetical protein DIU55_04780 [Bacillota bacterium]
MPLMARISALMDAYPRLLWMLAIGSFLNSVGFAFIWPLTTIYIHDHMGQSMTVAGVVLLFHSAGAALGQLAGGWLTDRVGARRVILTGLTLSALLMVVLGRYESWPVYVAVMIAFGVTSALSGPGDQRPGGAGLAQRGAAGVQLQLRGAQPGRGRRHRRRRPRGRHLLLARLLRRGSALRPLSALHVRGDPAGGDGAAGGSTAGEGGEGRRRGCGS